ERGRNPTAHPLRTERPIWSGAESMTRFAILAMLALSIAGASTARADDPTLTGNVGQGDSFIISLTGPGGTPVKNLDPGTYTLVVHDFSDIHDFHLFGPGNVDVCTDIGTIEDKTFTVTLVAGTYTYVCDAHPSMKGTFTVGGVAPTTTTTAKPPPPKPKPVVKHHKKKKRKR